MTDEEYTISGQKQPPYKMYRTCTFEGLGSRKDEFLGRVVEATEERGLKKVPAIKPFKLSLGVKDALRLWDWSVFDKMLLRGMVGTDVLLASDERGSHTRVGLRAETKDNNLRFGYFHCKWSDPKSVAQIKSYLELILYTIPTIIWAIFVGLFLLGKPFIEAHGELAFFFVFVPIAFIPMIPAVYIHYHKVSRPIKEIDRQILKIAESMGGKQITPFMKTTVELEN